MRYSTPETEPFGLDSPELWSLELFRLVRAHAEYTSTHGAVPSKHAPFPQESYTQRAAWIQKHRFAELLNSSAFPARELE